MKVLGKEGAKKLDGIIDKNYGSRINLEEFLIFEGKDEKIWVANKDVRTTDYNRLPVNSIGMHFCKIKRNGRVNLTMEGSQIVGKNAIKNIVYLDEAGARRFMQGLDVVPIKRVNCDYDNFVIVKLDEDILGCALLTEKGLKNLIPKSRRIPI